LVARRVEIHDRRKSVLLTQSKRIAGEEREELKEEGYTKSFFWGLFESRASTKQVSKVSRGNRELRTISGLNALCDPEMGIPE